MEQVEGLTAEHGTSKPQLERITPADIKPVVPEDGGSVFILQRNAKDKDNRDLPKESPLFGALDEGEAEVTEAWSKDYFDQIFKGLTPEERAKIDILIVAGNASLSMPSGKNSPHKRSVETAEHILAGIKASMTEYGVNPNQLLNRTGKPMELTSGGLLDLKILDESPDFVKFLLDKYGDTKDFWVAYEEDRHKDIREQMGAEGPEDIADRVASYMATLDNAMKLYHQNHPGRKVIVLANSQYDSISPTLKKYVTGQPMETYLPVDYRGGVVFEVGEDGRMSAIVQEHKYDVSFGQSFEGQTVAQKEISFADLKLEPMDPAKIEEVVNKYAEKHVQYKNGAIIFVGSGGGKSTICREQTQNSEGKTDLVDADLLYRETGAHPLQPGIFPLRPLPWWDMGDEVIHEVEKRCALVNEAMVKKGLWALTTSFTPEDPYVPSNTVVVILPWEEHKRRMILKFRGQFYDGGAKATDEGFALVQSHRKWAEEVAKEKNIPIVDSIEGAINLVRSRETNNS